MPAPKEDCRKRAPRSIVWVDYETQRRVPNDSARNFGKAIRSKSI
jgi:hypothetical protein